MRDRSQLKIARGLVIGLGLMLAPGLFGQACPSAQDGHAKPCKPSAVPEPSAIPELLLCLAVTGSGILFWRRNRQSV
jgi:hypothetical protein